MDNISANQRSIQCAMELRRCIASIDRAIGPSILGMFLEINAIERSPSAVGVADSFSGDAIGRKFFGRDAARQCGILAAPLLHRP